MSQSLLSNDAKINEFEQFIAVLQWILVIMIFEYWIFFICWFISVLLLITQITRISKQHSIITIQLNMYWNVFVKLYCIILIPSKIFPILLYLSNIEFLFLTKAVDVCRIRCQWRCIATLTAQTITCRSCLLGSWQQRWQLKRHE